MLTHLNKRNKPENTCIILYVLPTIQHLNIEFSVMPRKIRSFTVEMKCVIIEWHRQHGSVVSRMAAGVLVWE